MHFQASIETILQCIFNHKQGSATNLQAKTDASQIAPAAFICIDIYKMMYFQRHRKLLLDLNPPFVCNCDIFLRHGGKFSSAYCHSFATEHCPQSLSNRTQFLCENKSAKTNIGSFTSQWWKQEQLQQSREKINGLVSIRLFICIFINSLSLI